VFIIPLGQNNGNEKGPDTQAEAFRQMLAQHMVKIKYFFTILIVILKITN
jgi:collagen type V/XI/XXIV/XXVII alpha